MKTTVKSNEVPFGNLKVGDTYIDKDFGPEEIFMVVEPSIEVLLKPDRDVVDNTQFCGYGVSLTTGGIYGYPENELVVPVAAEVIGYVK